MVESLRGNHRFALLACVAALVLAGCASRTTQAPIADVSQSVSSSTESVGASTPAPARSYTIQPGDTLYKIAQSNNVDVTQLTKLNNITDPSQLRIGQTLRLSEGELPASVEAQPEPIEQVKPVEKATELASTDSTKSSSEKPATSTTPDESTAEPKAEKPKPTTPSSSRAADANLVNWGWPIKGKIIQGFNAATKGIDIEAQEGAPVIASADGKVMYAGNGVRGLGNLVLLGHSNGFISAYAHNQELLVKAGQEVKKGAKIATAGQTDTSSPRLHFEIRRRGTPVNPTAYLPAQ